MSAYHLAKPGRNIVHMFTSTIMQRAIYAMLDCGDSVESLSQHVGCAFENWCVERKQITKDNEYNAELMGAVQCVLGSIGHTW